MAEEHGIDMQTLSDSSSVNWRLLLSFLLFEVYMLVTVASTTDRMLLVPSTVQLPVANVDIPLFGFFFIAPLFMIALHFNFLVHLLQHTRKVREFLRQQNGSGQERDFNLPPFLFNYLQQFHPEQLQHHLLLFVLNVMVVLFPAAVLIYTQFKFSKYHSLPMTGWHYGILLIDLYIVRLYWPPIVNQEETRDEEETWRGLFEREKRSILLPLLQIILAALILAGLLILMHRFLTEWFGSYKGVLFYMRIELLVFLSFPFVVLLSRIRLSESGLFQGLWLLLWQSLMLFPIWKLLWRVVRFLVAPFKYALRKLSKTGDAGPKKSGASPDAAVKVGNLQGLLTILLAMAATMDLLLILALPAINIWGQPKLAIEIFKSIGPRIVVWDQLLVAGQPSDTIIQRYLVKNKTEETDWMPFWQGLDLEDRKLQFANFRRSRLFRVNLERAELQSADLRGAELQGGAKLGGQSFRARI